MQSVEKTLLKGEYFKETSQKNTIYIHHTNGSENPENVINVWDTDFVKEETVGKKKIRKIASAFVIGGRSYNESTYDGLIYQAFQPKYWAWHLGSVYANNKKLNQQSIGIDLCNYGALYKGADERFYTSVNTVIDNKDVVKLESPWKGYLYYHAYTDKQIISLKELIIFLKKTFVKIELRTPLTSLEGYSLNDSAKKGIAGIYTVCNVREDKNSISPQPKMMKMLQEVCSI